jgi:putative SbcD/Mre11-related phosphoesterase
MDADPAPAAVADLALHDRAILVGDSLVVADLHLGQGATTALDFPVGDGTDTVDRLTALLSWADPAELVIAGDVLHSFSTVPGSVRDALDAVVAAAADAGADLVLLEGNHDAMLPSAWDGELRESHWVGDTLVCHGHEAPDGTANRYLIGHEHPVLDAAGRRRPCYLVGDGVRNGSDVVVLPAFSRLLRGVSIDRLEAEGFMSPLVGDPADLAPLVWDDDAGEVVPFPPLGAFRERL